MAKRPECLLAPVRSMGNRQSQTRCFMEYRPIAGINEISRKREPNWKHLRRREEPSEVRQLIRNGTSQVLPVQVPGQVTSAADG